MATVNTERMQEITTTNKSKDDQQTEMMVRLDEKDEKTNKIIAQLTVSNSGSGGGGGRGNNRMKYGTTPFDDK